MKKTILFLMLACSPAVTASSSAQDAPPPPSEEHVPKVQPDELRQKEMARFREERKRQFQGALEKAAALEAEGKKDEAEEVRARARKEMQSALRQHQREMQEKMRGRPLRLRAERLGRGPGSGDPGHPEGGERPDRPLRPGLKQKLHHVEQAVDHLRQAGLPTPAANLQRVARRLRHALHDQPGPPAGRGPRPDGAAPGRDADAPRHDEIADLRREIEELKRTVGELCRMRGKEGDQEAPEKHH